MRLACFKNIVFITILMFISCGSSTNEPTSKDQTEDAVSNEMNEGDATADNLPNTSNTKKDLPIIMGADRWEEYRSLLEGKKVGVVTNQTSVIQVNDDASSNETTPTHLIDFLFEKDLQVQAIFAPEHGFRGKADAGELIKDGRDSKTGIPIISLYGKNKKPSSEQLKNIDVMVFDIQDVGARFYTYISTLHYVMEACAENNIPLLVLDRPNPNGHYIDGPILDSEHQSFVGMHPVPVVHGMTIGEYARMINGENWLKNGSRCELKVIPMENYRHDVRYSLPVKPSPNLPNAKAINLYPSLCFFEGTPISAGRGTEMQFQIFGAPTLPPSKYTFEFTPRPNEGAKYPKFSAELCYGKDLRDYPYVNQLHLEWLIGAYEAAGKPDDFFIPFFTKLAGTESLQQQIEAGMSPSEIRASWSNGLKEYDAMRQSYLLYK
ncbi:MAG: DUF1343 domain-containing protein [Flavobacteriaceae bacterium]|nr:DUF1343 domain-containing protein [Flavobacteriaceae bacterium]